MKLRFWIFMRRVWEDGVMLRPKMKSRGVRSFRGWRHDEGVLGGLTGQKVRHDDNSMVRKVYAMVKLSCKTKKNTVALLVREGTSLEKVEDRTTLKTKLFLIEELCWYLTKFNCKFAGNWTCFQFLRSWVSDPKMRDIPSYLLWSCSRSLCLIRSLFLA